MDQTNISDPLYFKLCLLPCPHRLLTWCKLSPGALDLAHMSAPCLFRSGKHAKPMLLWTWLTVRFRLLGSDKHAISMFYESRKHARPVFYFIIIYFIEVLYFFFNYNFLYVLFFISVFILLISFFVFIPF